MLDLRDLHKHWDHRPLLAGVSLRVAPGDTVALLGASGSGKSTLLKIVAGLEAPDRGSVCFGGQDLASVPPHRRGFALMFQDFALFPHLNVQDNVAFGLVEQGVPRAQARERAREMLVRFGLAEHARSRVWTLSGGEQQRVALARAVVGEPDLVLADEPTGNLDHATGAQVMDLLFGLAGARGATLVLITHDLALARRCARVVRLQDGRIAGDAPAAPAAP